MRLTGVASNCAKTGRWSEHCRPGTCKGVHAAASAKKTCSYSFYWGSLETKIANVHPLLLSFWICRLFSVCGHGRFHLAPVFSAETEHPRRRVVCHGLDVHILLPENPVLPRTSGCGSNPCIFGEHQNRWQMDVHPPQNGAINYAPWPSHSLQERTSRPAVRPTWNALLLGRVIHFLGKSPSPPAQIFVSIRKTLMVAFLSASL